MSTPMFGIVLVGVTWDGKRTHLNEMDEWGGFLTSDEGIDYAKKQIADYTQWKRYECIEVHDLNLSKNQTLVRTLYSTELCPYLDFNDKKRD